MCVDGARAEKEEQLQLVDAQSDQLQLPAAREIFGLGDSNRKTTKKYRQSDFNILRFAILC